VSETQPRTASAINVATFRNVLAIAGLLLWLAFLVPPVSLWSLRYEYAQAIQYCAFAVLAPALMVAGAPWKLLGLASREPHVVDADGKVVSPSRPRFIDRWSIVRSSRSGQQRAYVLVIVFSLMTIFWRVSPVVNALVRHPWLVVVESLALTSVGVLLWLDLIESPPVTPCTPRPYRIGMATTSMWVVWVLAYLLGQSNDSWYRAFHHVAGHGVSLSADQQLISGSLWLLTAGAFLPVIFWNLVHWLQAEEDPNDELIRLIRQDKIS
jgi:cytochrome c oxidase assembly factor CtaG